MKKATWIGLLSAALILLLGYAAFAVQVGTVQNLRGKAKIFQNSDPNTWIWAEVGSPIGDRDVIQVGPSSAIQVVINGQAITIQEKSSVQIAQVLNRGQQAVGQRNLRTPSAGNNSITAVAGVRASEVEGVDIGVLSWLNNENPDPASEYDHFVSFLNQMINNNDHNIIITVLDEYFAHNPQTDELVLVYGMAKAEFGDYDTAIDYINQASRDNYAETIDFYTGFYQYKKGSLDEAIATFTAFERNYPESDFLAQIQYYAGQAYAENGDQTNANTYFNKVLNNASASQEVKDLAQEALS